MTILIETLTFDAILGLLDFERDSPQRVIVDLEATYNYTAANFIDYSDVVLLVKNKLIQERYKLLEDALLGIKSTICSAYPQLTSLSIKVAKPDILPECSVALLNKWDFNH